MLIMVCFSMFGNIPYYGLLGFIIREKTDVGFHVGLVESRCLGLGVHPEPPNPYIRHKTLGVQQPGGVVCPCTK